ncbi:hypothetical protein [Shewanella woodyi]|uniref:hypothetical protein n=1 Tax=Shewanella woodyi TaxID=60961 RepID=UPI0007EB06C1|nr:hypothetical protein [Shewanella woodyi]
MNKLWKHSLICASLVFALTACSGGGGSSTPEDRVETPPPPPETVGMSGKVIDGYVSGATVWLDINGNGTFDIDSEPSTLSGAAGNYAFEFTQEQADCVPYATLYVDVPVGAIDEDLGEVTEAYQMSIPPSITPLNDDDIKNISPLTTVLWEQVAEKLKGTDTPNLSCENLKQDTQLRAELVQELSEVMNNLVYHYNLSEAQIYADFIADADSEAYDVAQAIVTGLKASYAHKGKLEAEFPDAHEIRVVIYQDSSKDNDFGFEQAWYRDTVIFTETGYSSEEVKLTADLSGIDIVLTDLARVDNPWGDQTLAGQFSTREDAYYNTDGTYRCSSFEKVSFKQEGITFELRNSSSSEDYSDTIDGCVHSASTPNSRNHFISFVEEGKNYFASFSFTEAQAEFNSLPDWVDFKDKAEQLSAAELIDHLSLLPRGWNDEVLIDTELWDKRMWFDNIQVDQHSYGNWTRATLQEDNTRVYECSTDGINWEACPS